MVALVSRITSTGIYSTNGNSTVGIFDEVSNAGVSKKTFANGTIMTAGILDETSIAGGTTAMREDPITGNISVSGYFDEVTGGQTR